MRRTHENGYPSRESGPSMSGVSKSLRPAVTAYGSPSPFPLPAVEVIQTQTPQRDFSRRGVCLCNWLVSRSEEGDRAQVTGDSEGEAAGVACLRFAITCPLFPSRLLFHVTCNLSPQRFHSQPGWENANTPERFPSRAIAVCNWLVSRRSIES